MSLPKMSCLPMSERLARRRRAVLHTASAAAVCLMVQCHPGSQTSETDSAEVAESYHADNDIAMTLLSITDAIQVGEPLDTAEYNFEGVLTDGQGAPLYTDIQGSPGQWIVDIPTPQRAIIRNIYLGDLLPDDLRLYIAETLDLTDSDIVECDDFDDDDEAELVVYRFDGGTLRFEQRAGIAPNGLEGPLLSIVVASAPK